MTTRREILKGIAAAAIASMIASTKRIEARPTDHPSVALAKRAASSPVMDAGTRDDEYIVLMQVGCGMSGPLLTKEEFEKRYFTRMKRSEYESIRRRSLAGAGHQV